MSAVVPFPTVPAPELVPTLGAELVADVAADSQVAPITTLAECQAAVNERKELGDRMKAVEAYFKPMKDAAHKAHRAICDREGAVLTPLKALDGKLRLAIQTFTAEQDRQRRAEEQRIADERRRDEQDRLAREAAALEQSGERELAAAVVDQAINLPTLPVVLPTVKQQVIDLKTRREWKWRYTNNDPAAAMKVLPRQFLAPDEKRIGQVVRAMKDAASIPGVEVYYEDVPVR